MRLTDSQLARYEHDGFLILPSLFSAAEVEALRSELPRLFAERRPENFREKESDAVRTAMGLHLRSEVYARVVRHPRLVEPAMQILGDELYVQQVKVNDAGTPRKRFRATYGSGTTTSPPITAKTECRSPWR